MNPKDAILGAVDETVALAKDFDKQVSYWMGMVVDNQGNSKLEEEARANITMYAAMSAAQWAKAGTISTLAGLAK